MPALPDLDDLAIDRLFPILLRGDARAATAVVDVLRHGRMRSPAWILQLVVEPIAAALHRLGRSRQVEPVALDRATRLLDEIRAGLRPAAGGTGPGARCREHRQACFVTTTLRAGVLRASLHGPSIGEREGRIIAEEIKAVLRVDGPAVRALVLDFSDVRMISSVGLNLCIDIRNVARDMGIRAIACGLSRPLQRLFRLLRLDRLWEQPRDPRRFPRLVAG